MSYESIRVDTSELLCGTWVRARRRRAWTRSASKEVARVAEASKCRRSGAGQAWREDPSQGVVSGGVRVDTTDDARVVTSRGGLGRVADRIGVPSGNYRRAECPRAGGTAATAARDPRGDLRFKPRASRPGVGEHWLRRVHGVGAVAPAANSDRAAGIVRLISWILAGDAVAAGSVQ